MNNNLVITGNLIVNGTVNLNSNSSSSVKCVILLDKEAPGVSGGTSIVGLTDRIFDTKIDSSNLITLNSGNALFSFNETGDYLITAKVNGYSGIKSVLTYSNNSVLIIGSSNLNESSITSMSSMLSGRLNVSDTVTNYKLRQYYNTAVPTIGNGLSSASGEDNVYAQLMAIKL